MNYLLLKAIHIIFVVSWFAGLFYIFRLYVYHVENWNSLDIKKVFLVMERKLLSYIMLPAALGTIALGTLMLIENPILLKKPWMHIKLTLVLVLLMYHGFSVYVFKQFSKDNKMLTSKQCRLINEVPTLILILVCILAFLKPSF